MSFEIVPFDRSHTKYLMAFHSYNALCTVSEIKHALEIWVYSHSRSLTVVLFDRSYTPSCQSADVSIALSCIIFDRFDVEEYSDLEI